MPGKPPDPGKLRHRVTFEQPGTIAATQQPSGAVPESWDQGFTVWAAVTPLTGRELLLAQQTVEQADGEIWCRWGSRFTQVDSSWHVLFKGRELNLTTVQNWMERNEWVYALYTERR